MSEFETVWFELFFMQYLSRRIVLAACWIYVVGIWYCRCFKLAKLMLLFWWLFIISDKLCVCITETGPPMADWPELIVGAPPNPLYYLERVGVEPVWFAFELAKTLKYCVTLCSFMPKLIWFFYWICVIVELWET